MCCFFLVFDTFPFVSYKSATSKFLVGAFEPEAVNVKSACGFSDDISVAAATILCAVEEGKWFIYMNSSAVRNAGCLLGAKRCDKVMAIPTRDQVPPSAPAPDSKSKQYQALATIAEQVVPRTWWRSGFSNDLLLLSHNDSELPRKQFDPSRLRNKKLKNMLQCATRQPFIRRSFPFDVQLEKDASGVSKCTAMSEQVVKSFLELWLTYSDQLGGVLKSSSGKFEWFPADIDDGKLLVSAVEV